MQANEVENNASPTTCPSCGRVGNRDIAGAFYCAACARSMRKHLSPEPRALEDELADACRAALDAGRPST